MGATLSVMHVFEWLWRSLWCLGAVLAFNVAFLNLHLVGGSALHFQLLVSRLDGTDMLASGISRVEVSSHRFRSMLSLQVLQVANLSLARPRVITVDD